MTLPDQKTDRFMVLTEDCVRTDYLSTRADESVPLSGNDSRYSTVREKIMTKKGSNRHQRLSCGETQPFVERFRTECERLALLQQRGPSPSTIWNARPDSEEDFFGPTLLILKIIDTHEGGNRLLVAEVSDRLDQATETDLLLLPHESGLHFNCILRTSNKFLTTSEWLIDPLGEIQTSLWPLFLKFCLSPEEFDYQISPLDYQFPNINGLTMMRRAGITSGLPFTDETDPRLSRLRKSIERCRYLSGHLDVARKPCHHVNEMQAFD